MKMSLPAGAKGFEKTTTKRWNQGRNQGETLRLDDPIKETWQSNRINRAELLCKQIAAQVAQ